MTPKASRPPQRATYRLTVHEEHPDGTDVTVMDAQGEAFIAIVGTHTHHGRIHGDHSHGGPQHTLDAMAAILTDTHPDHPPGTPSPPRR